MIMDLNPKNNADYCESCKGMLVRKTSVRFTPASGHSEKLWLCGECWDDIKIIIGADAGNLVRLLQSLSKLSRIQAEKEGE